MTYTYIMYVISGNVVVGKITYCANKVLGYGSEGTIVFK